MTLAAAQMRSLPEFFQNIDDPRRRQSRRHALPTVLALAAVATLCGMRGYKAIGEWVDDLSPRVLQRFRVRRRDGRYRPPSLSAIRSLLIRVDPVQLDAALRAWHEAHGSGDSALAIDSKSLSSAVPYVSRSELGLVTKVVPTDVCVISITQHKGASLMRSFTFLSVSARAKTHICIAVSACATKQFEEMPPLDATKLRAMSCEDIEQEFLMLQRHERGVDEEATSGQVEQMLWGGVWSVMADEKLEHVARQKIRDRERQLYEARLKKKCP